MHNFAQFTSNGENRITEGDMSPSSSLGGGMRLSASEYGPFSGPFVIFRN